MLNAIPVMIYLQYNYREGSVGPDRVQLIHVKPHLIYETGMRHAGSNMGIITDLKYPKSGVNPHCKLE